MPRPLTIGLLALAGVVVASGAGAGGYAINALSSSPVAEATPASDSENGTEPAADFSEPFGNAAGLSYTRVDGETFLVVVDGAGLAALTADGSEVRDGGVEFAFTGQYLADDGEFAVRSQDFFHFAHPGGVDPAGVDDSAVVRPAEETDLAVLTPEEPVQEFTVVLPDAPEQGALSYAPEGAVDLGLMYRTPLCYEAGGDFSPHREDCEDVPDPAEW